MNPGINYWNENCGIKTEVWGRNMSNQINKLVWKGNQLREGCMLAAIAHAIMVAHYPELSNEHSWDGINYSVQDSSGSRGTITFSSKSCVAAFRNENSTRISANNFIGSNQYFQGASQEIIKLAEDETLQYLLDNIAGETLPVITTAFWGEDNNLFTIDTLDEMVENGGFLLERQVMDMDSAIEAWKEYYDMSEQQCNMLKSIFKRKISQTTGIITLSKHEADRIGTDDQEGLEESKESFREIGIQWED